jgi:hypothetical protein
MSAKYVLVQRGNLAEPKEPEEKISMFSEKDQDLLDKRSGRFREKISIFLGCF